MVSGPFKGRTCDNVSDAGSARERDPAPPLPTGKPSGRSDLFDDPSYVNVDKPRPPAASAANGNAHRDAFDMSSARERDPAPPLPTGKPSGRSDLFDDPSYVNVDKPRAPAASAANGNAHRDAFDMSEWFIQGVPVRTKDHRFESVSHLISYHMDNHLPIISAGSEVCLQQPVERRA
ncbi:UNVERIFIED_CONTAM: hypothetical protein FKN15_000651 [Acipenser sinensis]